MLPGLISLLLFLTEFSFLLVIIIKRANHPQFLWIVLLMVFLQLYQLMEFFMCIGIDPNIIGRMGLVSITFLPPLGVLLTSYVTNLKHWINYSGILFGLSLSIYYVIVPNAFTLQTCNVFYAVYNYKLGNLYGVFYFGYILWAFVLISITFFRSFRKREKISNKNTILVLLGYLSFLIPMALTIVIHPSTAIAALESIMCKYAILLAIILLIFTFQHRNQDKIENRKK